MVDTALNNTAAMTVGANIDALGRDSIDDELDVRGSQAIETLLNDMIAVEVLNHSDDMPVQRENESAYLVRLNDVFNHLLESSGAVLIQGNPNHVRGGIIDQNGVLVRIGVFKKLLDQIVAKWISHELMHVVLDFVKDHFRLLWLAFGKLSLQVTTSVLVSAQGEYLPNNILQRERMVAMPLGFTPTTTSRAMRLHV